MKNLEFRTDKNILYINIEGKIDATNAPEFEEKINEIVEKFKALISANGELTNIDIWGKKKLAYEIDDLTEGYYVFIEFTAGPSFPQELERIYKITDGIIRDIVVKQED